MIRSIVLPAAWLFGSCLALRSPAQSLPSLADFRDGAHHWYDIRDKHNIINALPDRPVYPADSVQQIADNIIRYQNRNGGWPKNYDMQAILTAAQKDSLARFRDAAPTTFDNGATYAQIAYLAAANDLYPHQIYQQAITKGFHFILAAQYANGGWPQFYPLENNYSRYITFNDDAMLGILLLLQQVAENKPPFDFLAPALRKQLLRAYEKGIACVLRTQMIDNGIRTAWCQQYDEIKEQPAWARKFEPPAICNNESAGIVLFLMSLPNPSAAVQQSIRDAVNWFRISAIHDTVVKTIDAPVMVTSFTVSRHDKRVVYQRDAPLIWTRYYEPVTHRPLFCNRDSKYVYSLAEVERERRDGYGWYTYAPQKVLDLFPPWEEKHPLLAQ
ncbi:MAG TPA: pectate lyase [Sediminibacterium sp.]|nr:pectate lyase [Sediminibacterium sp.]